MYKWLLFDVDDTLFDFDQAELVALQKTFKEFELPYQEAHLEEYHQINDQLWRDLERGKISQEKLKVRRFELFLETLNILTDPILVSRGYMKHLAASSDLWEGAEQLIETLAPQFQLAIITNGIAEVQHPRLQHSTIGKYFAEVIISEEVGAAKPDPKIFDAAFRKMGQPQKSDVLIIGDSLTSDIQGGINYGIDTCWFNTKGQKKPDALNITYEIHHLHQLSDILLQQ